MSAAAWMEHAPAYALDALDAPEREAFEAELARSPELQSEVDALREVASLLALAAPVARPRTDLRTEVLESAHSVRPIVASRPRAEQRATSSAQRARPFRVATVVPWLALAASVAGVFVMRGRYLDARTESAVLVQATDSMRRQIASRDSLIAALLAPEVETVKLSATGRPPTGRLYWNRQSSEVVFAAFALPPAPAGRTYQLWAIASATSAPVSLGTFNTTTDGVGRLAVRLPQGTTIAIGAVTEEPEGGSPQPTTQPFLVGQLRASE
jgi:anti-sigma-K factor RskA